MYKPEYSFKNCCMFSTELPQLWFSATLRKKTIIIVCSEPQHKIKFEIQCEIYTLNNIRCNAHNPMKVGQRFTMTNSANHPICERKKGLSPKSHPTISSSICVMKMKRSTTQAHDPAYLWGQFSINDCSP